MGHCWPPAPGVPDPIASKFKNGDAAVTVDGSYPVLVGDTYNIHAGPCGLIPPHEAAQCFVGTTTVFIGGIAVVRDADPLSCGDVADAGDTQVFVEGGGFGGPEATVADPEESTGFATYPAVVDYPPITFTYQVRAFDIGNNSQFLRGNEGSFKPSVYTPLSDGSQFYPNYPGPPFSEKSGADLPDYATPFYKQPVPITGFRLTVSGYEVTNGLIYQGIYFNYSTGEISGRITSDPRAKDNTVPTIPIGVAAINRVGRSEFKPFNVYIGQGGLGG